MANDALIDFMGDGGNSDTILSYVHIQTAGYSGSYNDFVCPASPNFPLTGKDSSGNNVSPSRYIVRLNFTPFKNGSLPLLVKDGGTTLTLVSGAPGVNQYRWWYNDNNSTVCPDVLEFHSGQAGHTISIDCYAKQSILHAAQYNAPLNSGNLSVSGNAAVTGTLTVTGNYGTINSTTENVSGTVTAGKVIEGSGTSAGGLNAHAEGNGSNASGVAAHAEGYQSTANGDYGHSEGYQTTASVTGAHAEGLSTLASAQGAHAQGNNSIANRNGQHAIASTVFAINGDQQGGNLVLGFSTLTSGSQLFSTETGKSYAIMMQIVMRFASGLTRSCYYFVDVKNVGGTVTVVGSGTINELGDTVSGFSVSISVATVNLQINAGHTTGNNARIVMYLTWAEVGY